MPYRDIVVYLDASELNESRVLTAINIAKHHKAKLIGVDISTAEALDGERREQAQAIEDTFEQLVRAAGVEAECRVAGTSAKTAQDLSSHCADLSSSQASPMSAALISRPLQSPKMFC